MSNSCLKMFQRLICSDILIPNDMKIPRLEQVSMWSGSTTTVEVPVLRVLPESLAVSVRGYSY